MKKSTENQFSTNGSILNEFVLPDYAERHIAKSEDVSTDDVIRAECVGCIYYDRYPNCMYSRALAGKHMANREKWLKGK